jgi:hypothetical protein
MYRSPQRSVDEIVEVLEPLGFEQATRARAAERIQRASPSSTRARLMLAPPTAETALAALRSSQRASDAEQ